VDGYLVTVRKRKPELADTEIIYASTPDYVGGFEDGYSAAVTAIVNTLVKPLPVNPKQLTLLPGSHLASADLDELREIIEAFGLSVIVLPDISGSLDGHIAPDWRGTTLGGTTLEQIRAAGASALTLGVGEQTRLPALALQKLAGTPLEIFDRLTGLEVNDRFLQRLSQLSGKPVPDKYRRQRSQLLDAMLDGHFYTGGIKVAIGAEPDLLLAVGSLLHEMGAELRCCVSTTKSASHALLPAQTVILGDLEDLEQGAADCDLLITHSHGRQAAERLNKPLLRIGFPVFDRIGNAHRCQVGYRGSMALIFEIANLMMAQIAHHHATDWPLTPEAMRAATQLPSSSSPEVAASCKTCLADASA
jgi:nitrogenase molybdenum-iron protein NifN